MLNTVFAKFWNMAETPLTETEYLGNYSDSPCDEFTVTNEEVLFLVLIYAKQMVLMAYMLKATTESIASPLAKLFSLPLSTGKYPTLWKSASIVPIPQSTNKSNPSDYKVNSPSEVQSVCIRWDVLYNLHSYILGKTMCRVIVFEWVILSRNP